DCTLREVRFLIRNLYVPLENPKEVKGFIKPDRCAVCAAYAVCPGVKPFYVQAHGVSELVPLKGDGA
ncbi:MAG TPA: hypothetical protein PLQ76_08415, partial [bacterium]|nr:hypothetical protein [bacterium]